MPNIGFDDQPVKTFDFYINVNLKVCIFDKTFSKQAAAKAHPLAIIKEQRYLIIKNGKEIYRYFIQHWRVVVY